jgi:hypothetical protein
MLPVRSSDPADRERGAGEERRQRAPGLGLQARGDHDRHQAAEGDVRAAEESGDERLVGGEARLLDTGLGAGVRDRLWVLEWHDFLLA